MAPLRVVQLSDTHLSHRRAYSVPNVAAVLRWVRDDPPDLVVLSGDLVADDPDDADERAFARSLLGDLQCPWVAVPGNHDTGGFSADLFDTRRLDTWRETWGDDTFCEDVAGWRLVGADVYRLGEADHDGWLRAALGTDRPIALFLHQPICLVAPDVADEGDWSLPMDRRAALLDALEGRPVRVVASGHLHRYRTGSLPGGPTVVWCPAASFLGTRSDDSHYVVGVVEHLLGDDGRPAHRLVQPDGVRDLWFADFAPPGASGLREAPLLPHAEPTG